VSLAEKEKTDYPPLADVDNLDSAVPSIPSTPRAFPYYLKGLSPRINRFSSLLLAIPSKAPFLVGHVRSIQESLRIIGPSLIAEESQYPAWEPRMEETPNGMSFQVLKMQEFRASIVKAYRKME
jgi:hypothetical protein